MSNMLSIAVSGLKSYSNLVATETHNLTNSSGVSGRRIDTLFFSQVTNNTASAISTEFSGGGTRSITRTTLDQQGTITSTGIATDLAVNGQGMFVVITSLGDNTNIAYTRSGSFRQDASGNFVNQSGAYLMAWKLNPDGDLPGGPGTTAAASSSLLSSLSVVNLSDVSGAAAPTQKVKVGIDLDAKEQIIKGNGQNIQMPISGSKNSAIQFNEIIIPDSSSEYSISIGDQLMVRTDDNTWQTFTYGGVTSSPQLSEQNKVLGAKSSADKFTSAVNGDTFQVNCQDKTWRFTFSDATSVNSALGQFNDLDSLRNAINHTQILKARISDNAIFITPVNGNDAVTFLDLDTSKFVNDLQLRNISAGNNRFSTLENLTSQLNSVQGFSATGSTGNSIEFHASDPTSSMSFQGKVNQTKSDSSLTVNSASNQYKRSIRVNSSGNGLKVGDYIKVSGLQDLQNGVAAADGIFMVGRADASSFDIYSTTDASASGSVLRDSDSISWSRCLSQNYDTETLPNPRVGITGSTLKINATNALEVGDRILLQGFNSGADFNGAICPDGYYEITARDATSFSIDIPIPGTGGTVNMSGNISYTKIAADASNPISTVLDSKKVKIYQKNHRCSIGDSISFHGIPQNQSISLSGISISDKMYTVKRTGTDVNGDFIEIEGDTPATATGDIAAPSNFALNNFGSMFKTLSLSTTTTDFTPAYNSNGGITGTNFAESFLTGTMKAGTYTKSITVYDSLGVGHDFRISFGKLEQNRWAVEIHNTRNSDGSFDVLSTRKDGQVASGIIEFNGDGTLFQISPSLAAPVSISWNNQALQSNILFDWGTSGPPKGTQNANIIGLSDGLRQVSKPYEVRFIEQDGLQPGNLNSVSIDNEGYIISGFTNGATKKIYKIPVATFPNINGLAENSGNLYTQTSASGAYNLVEASKSNFINIISSSIEQSNIDQVRALTNIVEANSNYQMIAIVLGIMNKLNDSLDRNMSV